MRTSERGHQKKSSTSSAACRFEVPRRTRGIHRRNFKSAALEGARERAAIEQDVLPCDEAGLVGTEEGASKTELLGVAEAAGRILLGAFHHHRVGRDAALLGLGLGGIAQAVGGKGSRQ